MGFYHRRNVGFSLIEVLVVLFIIGLVIGMVSVQVNIGGDSDSSNELQSQVEDFLQKAQFAEDQAVLTGKPYGLVIEPPNLDHEWMFRWQRYQLGQWGDAEEVLAAQTFPEGIDLAAEVEGAAVEFDNFGGLNKAPPLPIIVFYPGGEVTPFTMTLFDRTYLDESAMISSEVTGVVQLLDDTQIYDDFFNRR